MHSIRTFDASSSSPTLLPFLYLCQTTALREKRAIIFVLDGQISRRVVVFEN